jgi:hypothetical protein
MDHAVASLLSVGLAVIAGHGQRIAPNRARLFQHIDAAQAYIRRFRGKPASAMPRTLDWPRYDSMTTATLFALMCKSDDMIKRSVLRKGSLKTNEGLMQTQRGVSMHTAIVERMSQLDDHTVLQGFHIHQSRTVCYETDTW